MGVIASKFAFLPPNPPGPLHADCRLIVTASGDKIPIYFVQKKSSKYIVIYSHGNAETLTHGVALLEEISRRLDVSVLGYEYIGYPHTVAGDADESPSIQSSTLTPSEQGCYESIDAAYNYIANVLGYDAAHQIWMGQSIGSGPTVDFVSRGGKAQICFAGMILISPFDSGVSLFSPFLANFYDMFDNGAKMRHVTTPTLIIHGSADDVVPATQSKLLESRAHCDINRCVINGAGHNNLFRYGETWNLIGTWAKELMK